MGAEGAWHNKKKENKVALKETPCQSVTVDTIWQAFHNSLKNRPAQKSMSQFDQPSLLLMIFFSPWENSHGWQTLHFNGKGLNVFTAVDHPNTPWQLKLYKKV